MLWSERTWAELPKDLAAVGFAAMLPVGATEQHGPHLGCGVDAVLADKLCTAVAVRTRVPMLPALPLMPCAARATATASLSPIVSTLGLIRFIRQDFGVAVRSAFGLFPPKENLWPLVAP